MHFVKKEIAFPVGSVTKMSAQACLEIDVDVEKIIEIRLPEPLGPGLGFLFAFVVGGILGAVLARFCFRDYLKSKVSIDLISSINQLVIHNSYIRFYN